MKNLPGSFSVQSEGVISESVVQNESQDNGHSPRKVPRFWAWLAFKDSEGDRGISSLWNRWLVFHAGVAVSLSLLFTQSPINLAKSVSLPGAAILIGLAFGWAGRSAGLLQDKAYSKFLIENGPSPEGYVYSFQLAILSVLSFVGVALILVGGGTGISLGSTWLDDHANRAILFFTGSIAVRESWGIIDFVNKLTIQYYRVREFELKAEREREAPSTPTNLSNKPVQQQANDPS